MKKDKKAHLKISFNNFYCANCGAKISMNLPKPVKEVVKKGKAFEILHIDCKKTNNQL